jgi:hypothetical protein
MPTLASINLSTNPSYQSTELVIQRNTLAYGLHKFTFKVDITIIIGATNILLSNEMTTFVEIIPTGLVVLGLEDAVYDTLIGSNQSFNFDPSRYSFDLDDLIASSSFEFKFYCMPINTSETNTLSNQPKWDLLTFKSNSSLLLSKNQTCFTSNSKTNFIIKS